jgi:hypothetical protein
MALTQFTDDDIELLLRSGETTDPDLSDLAILVSAIRDERISDPRTADVDRIARGAAAVARSRATTIQPASRLQPRRTAMASLRTYSSVAMTIFVLVAVSSLGLVANAADPGDSWYVLDLAMEKVGIGAGSLGERTSEAHVLADRGNHDDAVAHLTASISEARETAPEEDLVAALTALDEYTEMVEGPGSPGTPGMGDPANENAGPGNNNAGGNSETNENAGPGNNNAGGNGKAGS